MKLVPFTVSVRFGPPTTADAGVMLVSVGILGIEPITKVAAFEVPPLLGF